MEGSLILAHDFYFFFLSVSGKSILEQSGPFDDIQEATGQDGPVLNHRAFRKSVCGSCTPWLTMGTLKHSLLNFL